MELASLIGLLFIVNLALAQNLPYVIKKVCIEGECKEVIAIDERKLYGHSPSAKESILKVLGALIFIIALALIVVLLT